MNSPPRCRQAILSRTISQTMEPGPEVEHQDACTPKASLMAEVGSHFGAVRGSPENVAGTKDEKPQSLGQQIGLSSLSDVRRCPQNEAPASFSALARTPAPDCSSLHQARDPCDFVGSYLCIYRTPKAIAVSAS
jgi:hypothetical protein